MLSKVSGKQVQVLWDGLSLVYAEKAYPIIHEIENTMRKLITKFMMINIGTRWTNESIPKEVLESIRSKSAKQENNHLYEVDFIQLSYFLFKDYTYSNLSGLLDKLKKATKLEDLNLSELKGTIPTSNWDRHFSTIVKCDGDYIKSRWEKLYEKRNLVAHNKQIGRVDYDDIIALCGELMPKLTEAIDNLDKIVISEAEKEIVSENVASSRSDVYMEFITSWAHFQRMVYFLANLLHEAHKLPGEPSLGENNLRNHLNLLYRKYGIITSQVKRDILEIFQLRNIIVHRPDIIIGPNHIQSKGAQLRGYALFLSETISGIEKGGVENVPKPKSEQPDPDDDEKLD
ncbi:MAG: HEPN domain-containing protein [Verrucomicrobia bacterium]|nr:HEPN domain-containing protein [Verrucomicrobiota bacterium]